MPRYVYLQLTLTALLVIQGNKACQPGIHINKLYSMIEDYAKNQNIILGSRWRSTVTKDIKTLAEETELIASYERSVIRLVSGYRKIIKNALPRARQDARGVKPARAAKKANLIESMRDARRTPQTTDYKAIIKELKKQLSDEKADNAARIKELESQVETLTREAENLREENAQLRRSIEVEIERQPNDMRVEEGTPLGPSSVAESQDGPISREGEDEGRSSQTDPNPPLTLPSEATGAPTQAQSSLFPSETDAWSYAHNRIPWRSRSVEFEETVRTQGDSPVEGKSSSDDDPEAGTRRNDDIDIDDSTIDNDNGMETNVPVEQYGGPTFSTTLTSVQAGGSDIATATRVIAMNEAGSIFQTPVRKTGTSSGTLFDPQMGLPTPCTGPRPVPVVSGSSSGGSGSEPRQVQQQLQLQTPTSTGRVTSGRRISHTSLPSASTTTPPTQTGSFYFYYTPTSSPISTSYPRAGPTGSHSQPETIPTYTNSSTQTQPDVDSNRRQRAARTALLTRVRRIKAEAAAKHRNLFLDLKRSQEKKRRLSRRRKVMSGELNQHRERLSNLENERRDLQVKYDDLHAGFVTTARFLASASASVHMHHSVATAAGAEVGTGAGESISLSTVR